MDNVKYAGFWIRFIAHIIDSVILTIILIPLVLIFFWGAIVANAEAGGGSLGLGANLFIYGIVIAFVLLFWITKSATPGKMVFSTKIVDAQTGGKPSAARFVGRYLAYFVSGIPLGLGFLWVAFDKRKQGWHDKLAGTVVVRR